MFSHEYVLNLLFLFYNYESKHQTNYKIIGESKKCILNRDNKKLLHFGAKMLIIIILEPYVK
jgi:hypothetical protein